MIKIVDGDKTAKWKWNEIAKNSFARNKINKEYFLEVRVYLNEIKKCLQITNKLGVRRENQHDLVLLRHPEHYIHIGWIIIFRNHDELETAAQSNYAQSLCPKACAPISDLTTTLIDLDTISCQLICYLLHSTSHSFAPAFFNIFLKWMSRFLWQSRKTREFKNYLENCLGSEVVCSTQPYLAPLLLEGYTGVGIVTKELWL